MNCSCGKKNCSCGGKRSKTMKGKYAEGGKVVSKARAHSKAREGFKMNEKMVDALNTSKYRQMRLDGALDQGAKSIPYPEGTTSPRARAARAAGSRPEKLATKGK